MPSPAVFFYVAATVFLIFTSVSAPTWEFMSFLNVDINGTTVNFGVFGYTGTKLTVGYGFNQSVLGLKGNQFDSTLIRHLTGVLILHPVAATLSGFAFIFGICDAAYHRAGTALMTLLATLATLATLVVFIVQMILFGVARNRFRSGGAIADFGNANWLTVGSLVSLIIGFCASTVGIVRLYKKV